MDDHQLSDDGLPTKIADGLIYPPNIANPRIEVTIRKDGRALTVALSAHSEFNRIGRLCTVALGIATDTLDKIAGLHDHKGTLGVTWMQLPTAADIAAVHIEWQEQSECTTDHFFDGRSLLDNCHDEPPSAFGAANILTPRR